MATTTLKNTVNQEELLSDIEALKKAKTEKEVKAIMSKYTKALTKMDAEKAKAKEAKQTPAKKKAEPQADGEKKGRQYNGKYEVFPSADGYAYRLKASNGEVLVNSEVYTSKAGVLKAIENVKKNVEAGEIRIFCDKRGKYKFKLTSKNYRVLVISANYSIESSAQKASESFKKFALKADIVEIELEDTDAALSTPIKITSQEDKTGGKYVVEEFNGEYSWDLKATNGQILTQAYGYTSKAGCLGSIEKFKSYCQEGEFKCVKDKSNHYCYKLYTKAGRVAAVGESYTTKTAATSAANSVMSFYKLAEIVEEKDSEPVAKQPKKTTKA